jgi:hypothetical protein
MLYFSTLIWLFYCPLYLFAIPLLALSKKTQSSRNEEPCLSFPVIAMNAISRRRTSGFAKADACCRVVLNAVFFYSSMALVAEISAFIIYAVHVMRDALRGALLSPRKEV